MLLELSMTLVAAFNLTSRTAMAKKVKVTALHTEPVSSLAEAVVMMVPVMKRRAATLC
jgi:hypothetical protein